MLLAAAKGEDADEVRRLVNGVNVECADEKGLTPLMWAAKGRNIKCVEILLEAGAALEATNRVRRRALSPHARPRESPPAVPLPRAHGENAAFSCARLRCARAARHHPADAGSMLRSCRHGPPPPRPWCES